MSTQGDPSSLARLGEILGTFPRFHLGAYPSPVRSGRSPEGRNFWIKDDGSSDGFYGGNKIRKLEYFFGWARESGRRVLVTHGDIESHTVQATGVMGTRAGFDVHAVVFPHRGQLFTAPEIIRLKTAGVHVHRRATFPGAVTQAHWMAWRMKDAVVVPLGGTTSFSTLGYVRAALELAEQVRAGLLPPPARIYLPFATGGTVAGLLVGLALTGMETRLVAVQTVERVIASRGRLERLVRATLRLLGREAFEYGRCLERLEKIDPLRLGRGYRDVSPEIHRAVVQATSCGLRLETSFSGKAFASMLAALGEGDDGEFLFWNTHDQVCNAQAGGGC